MFDNFIEFLQKGRVYKWNTKLWIFTADGPGETFMAVEYGETLPAPVYLIPTAGSIPLSDTELRALKVTADAEEKH